jgi:hypothetical protein
MGLDNGDRTFLGEYAYLMVAFRFSYIFLGFTLKTVLTYSFYKLRWNYQIRIQILLLMWNLKRE